MNLLLKIRRGETPFYARIKSFIMSINRFDLPYSRTLYKIINFIRLFIVNLCRWLKSKFWDQPIFKSICKNVGKGLLLPQGLPVIKGNPEINVGVNVTLYRLQIETYIKNSKSIIEIGDNTVIGPDAYIGLSNEIIIGSNCLLGPNNLIMDFNKYDDEDDKRNNYVVIEENVWTGRNVSILKGVRIGKNSIISANSLVLNDIPENVIAMGVPAQIVLKNVDKFYKDIR